MKKSFVGVMALALVLPLLGWLGLSSAQDNSGKKGVEPAAKKGASDSPGSSRFHARSHPGPISSSKIHFKTTDGRELRTILVDLPDETDDRTFQVFASIALFSRSLRGTYPLRKICRLLSTASAANGMAWSWYNSV